MRDRTFLEALKHDIVGMELDGALQRHIETILMTPISVDTFRWKAPRPAMMANYYEKPKAGAARKITKKAAKPPIPEDDLEPCKLPLAQSKMV
jgi:hypothetical protein